MNLSSQKFGANQRKKREPQFLLNCLKLFIFKKPLWGFSPESLILTNVKQRISNRLPGSEKLASAFQKPASQIQVARRYKSQLLLFQHLTSTEFL